MEFANLLVPFVSLIAMFASQVYLVKRSTAFIKEVSGAQGNAARLVSFGSGAVFGGLFLWPWVELNPGYPLSVYVVTGVLFVIVAGLTASGDYDLKAEDEAVKSGVLGNRSPEK